MHIEIQMRDSIQDPSQYIQAFGAIWALEIIDVVIYKCKGFVSVSNGMKNDCEKKTTPTSLQKKKKKKKKETTAKNSYIFLQDLIPVWWQ